MVHHWRHWWSSPSLEAPVEWSISEGGRGAILHWRGAELSCTGGGVDLSCTGGGGRVVLHRSWGWSCPALEADAELSCTGGGGGAVIDCSSTKILHGTAYQAGDADKQETEAKGGGRAVLHWSKRRGGGRAVGSWKSGIPALIRGTPRLTLNPGMVPPWNPRQLGGMLILIRIY